MRVAVFLARFNGLGCAPTRQAKVASSVSPVEFGHLGNLAILTAQQERMRDNHRRRLAFLARASVWQGCQMRVSANPWQG
jgi:hypothetical protein